MNDFAPGTLGRLAIQRAFSKAAASYDAAAVLQRKVADELELNMKKSRPN